MKYLKNKNFIIPLILVIIFLITAIIIILNSNFFYFFSSNNKVINDFNIYGESINIKINNTYENDIDLFDINNKKVIKTLSTKKEIDKGINPKDIPLGEYYLQNSGIFLKSKNKDINFSFVTTPKDSQYYEVSLFKNPLDYVGVSKKKVNKTDECDIMIDPGHGGDDSGAISKTETKESIYNLEYAKALQKELNKKGYNTCITRNKDINPGNIKGSSYIGEGARVYQFYENKAKYGLSIHFNAVGKGGYQVYSSVRSSNDFALDVAKKMDNYFYGKMIVSDFIVDKKYITLKKYINKDEDLDYYYIIRETGGKALGNRNFKNEYKNNTFGTHTLLLELGYIDNLGDLKKIENNDFKNAYVKEIAQAVDKYVQSK